MILEAYKEKFKLSDDQMREYAAMGETCPEDYPKVKKGRCGGNQPLNYDDVVTELDDVKVKIEEFEKNATEDADKSKQEDMYTGIVFIVFKSPLDCIHVIQENSRWPITKFIARSLCGCIPGSWKFTFERAPEPSDIYWENIGVSTCTRVCKSLFSFILTAILMGFCVGFIAAIKQAQYAQEDKTKELDENASYAEQGMSQFISVMCSLSVSIANAAMILIIRRFSMSEKHETLTKLNVSVAIKLTIARFLNSSVILVITNGDPKGWFKGGSLAYDASLLILIMVF
jgi:hypothetical protein